MCLKNSSIYLGILMYLLHSITVYCTNKKDKRSNLKQYIQQYLFKWLSLM